MRRISLSGRLGSYTVERLTEALDKARGEPVMLELFSPGGLTRVGMECAAAIMRHGNVTVVVSSMAASAAMFLAVAARKFMVSTGALLMLHPSSNASFGNRDDHQANVEFLDKENTSQVNFLAEQMKQGKEVVQSWLSKETWFTADEAISLGFAEKATARALRHKPSDSLTVIARYFGYGYIYGRAKAMLGDKSMGDETDTDPQSEEIQDPKDNPEGDGDPFVVSGPGAKLQFRDGTQAIAVTQEAWDKAKSDLATAETARDEAQSQLDTLRADDRKREAKALVEFGVANGYLTPAQSDEWEALALADIDRARSLMKVQPKSPFVQELGSTGARSSIPVGERRELDEGFMTQDEIKALEKAREQS